MGNSQQASGSLRQRQADDTRRTIIETALSMLEKHPRAGLSHEQIANEAGIARRTVYRYFPSTTELLEALWQESTKRLQLTRFPSTEAELLGAVEPVFRALDENSSLIQGLLYSNAGQEMRRRDNEPRRIGIAQALQNATSHLPEEERRKVTAVFQVLFSARAWEIMRDRASLEEGEAAQAVSWALQALLRTLYNDQKQASKGPARKSPAPRGGKERATSS